MNTLPTYDELYAFTEPYQTTEPYKFRGLPCTGLVWYVSGQHTDEHGNIGGGILEWCTDEHDAYSQFMYMGQWACLSDLHVRRIEEGRE